MKQHFFLIAMSAVLLTGLGSCQRQSQEDKGFTDMFSQNEKSVKKVSSIGDPRPVDLSGAAETAVHAVVHIKATQVSKTQIVEKAPDFFDYFFGNGHGQQYKIQTQPRIGFGSGVIISRNGYIVTNHHVVEGADEITVKLNDERTFKGKLIGTDAASDLALIKIKGEDFPTIPIGNSDELKVGEWVIAVGNPFELNSTVTAGIVSAKARSLSTTSSDGKTPAIQSFIQTDAAINAGNSGGALVNARGQLVGINAMLYSPTGSYSGYGFAIPTSIMKKVVSDLRTSGKVQRAVLGISGGTLGTDLKMDDNQMAQMRSLINRLGVRQGVLVAEVMPESPAQKAGMKRYDVIVSLGGREVANFTELQEALARHRPGDTVEVKYVRDKKIYTVNVTL